MMKNNTGFNVFPRNSTVCAEPFEVHVDAKVLSDLRLLLELLPIAPATYENTLADASLGLRREWLIEAIEHWKNSFDWSKHEDKINSFPQFIAPIVDDGGRCYHIHFVALFSRKPDAIPILLLHGWPGSFLEFLPMLDLFSNEYTPESLPYHLVVPSLPGYTFSSPPPLDKDFRIEDVARLFNKLAIQLGFGEGYVVQGGDIGSKISRVIAAEHDACKAIHINFCIMPKPEEDDIAKDDKLNALDIEGLKRAEGFSRTGSAYALEHATRPSTISFALASSPIALLSWIGEKFIEWTDDDPPLDVILESVTLYWVTQCFPTTIYPYRQLFTPGNIGAHENPVWHIYKPFGFSWFPKEIAPIPKAWAATTGTLKFFRQHTKGGHFAAVEQTATLKEDLQAFVEQVWEW